MRVLFCKVSYMKFYKGHHSDGPLNGGKYVQETGYGHEEFNFLPLFTEGESEEECLGFVEPKSHGDKRNSFHLENIDGCSNLKDAPSVDDVLVVWYATRQQNCTTVVGWYKHATVWRNLQNWTLVSEDGEEEERAFNVRAKASDCTLLPEEERNKWALPSAGDERPFNFGQMMVHYPTEEKVQPYLAQLIKRIDSYNDENWLYTFPEA